MKNRVPLGDLIREANATASSYEWEVTNAVFSSLEECNAFAAQEKLGPTWGIYYDDQGFWLCQPVDTDAPRGFVQWCPPDPPEPTPPKWGNYCAACGGVVWAGQAFCADCGWAEEPGWEE